MRKLKMLSRKVASKVEGEMQLAYMKLKEQEGSLLEYLGEHIIGVIIIGIVIAALVSIITVNVIPGLKDKIADAFNYKA